MSDIVERLREVSLAGEAWAIIPGFENYYVSDFGRVFSIPRRRTSGGFLRQRECSGYLCVCVYSGVRRSPRLQLVHRLVLLAHIGAPPDGAEAAHRDGDRANNKLANLYWASKAENTADRARHGNFRKAMDARKKLPNEDVDFIRSNHRLIRQIDLAKMFGVHRATIQRIHSGERY